MILNFLNHQQVTGHDFQISTADSALELESDEMLTPVWVLHVVSGGYVRLSMFKEKSLSISFCQPVPAPSFIPFNGLEPLSRAINLVAIPGLCPHPSHPSITKSS